MRVRESLKELKKLTELRLQRANVLTGALADEKVCIVNLYQRESLKEHKNLTELRLQRANVLIGALTDEKVCIVNLYQRESH